VASVGLWVGSQVGNIVSVVLRGSTQNYLDDVERAVEDGTRTGLCCAVRVLVVLLGATEQSAHIAATE